MSSGFAAGTLVHTDKGLIPIQNLKVGDLVLSRHKSDLSIEPIFKKVLQVFKIPNQEVFRMTYCADDQWDNVESTLSYLIVTKEQLFWTKSQNKWSENKKLVMGDAVVLSKKNEQRHFFLANNQIFQTHNSKGEIFGFCDAPLSSSSPIKIETIFKISSDSIISYFDPFIFAKYKPNNGITLTYEEKGDIGKYAQDKVLLTDVYNIEVEEFHTYSVGEQGLWVGDSTIQGNNE
ncbi:Hint domain-containing protein [Moraxella osloensis]|nr:Hint domain-containing protein [Moraxella osloensis]UAY37362.1 Hint domain-containing protein [Moraxella osloensis]